MKNIIEIKAKNKESAINRAIKILEIDKEQIMDIIEKKKPFSFLGLFTRDGIYEIEIKSKQIDKKEEISEILTDSKKEKTHEIDRKDEILEKGKKLLMYMGLNLEISVEKKGNKNYYVTLSGEDNGIIIGKKGKTLNSYEYLLNVLIKDMKIDVDVEGFKEKRDETLRELALKMVQKALKSQKPIKLNPMPPRERKIIHEVINNYKELDTYSEGKEPNRYIVIKKKR